MIVDVVPQTRTASRYIKSSKDVLRSASLTATPLIPNKSSGKTQAEATALVNVHPSTLAAPFTAPHQRKLARSKP